MSPRGTLAVLSVAVLVGFARPDGPEPKDAPREKEAPPVALYHADRDHLWNRVHAALLVRVGPDGKAYGQDRLEPLLWLESKNLLEGKTAERAVAVLEEFVREKGETLVADPLRRAVLQRDLWLVANWLQTQDRGAARERLEVPLAKVIRRLALTPEEIAKLPDNYAAAVASKEFADRFDPEKPGRAYLPPDLFKPDGPWVCVGRRDGPTAPQHLDVHNAEVVVNPFTNSAFLVFLKLPGGRAATLEFLTTLAAFDKPLYVPTEKAAKRRIYRLPNPALPQWPRGTEVALVRRGLLIDSSRRVVAGPLTESVQIRVTRTDTPEFTPEAFKKIEDAVARKTADWQAFAEFQVRRADLFAARRVGLRDVSGDRDFKTGFAAHVWDEFTSPLRTGPFPERGQPFENNRASCLGCHQLPGVYGFNSFHGDFAFTPGREPRADDSYVPRSHALVAAPVAKVEEAAVTWREGRPTWTALRKLLPE